MNSPRSARALLGLFMLVSALVYADRGIASSAAVSGAPRSAREPAGRGLQGALGCSYAAYGALNAAFMIGLLAGAPAFSAMANRANPLRLIAVGLSACAAGELGCALAPTYGFAFASRALVGAGEASFVALAAPFIDDSAPKRAKTMWLAMFYACVPFGVAFGIAFGGAVAPALGWRWAFGLNACAMAPAAAYCFWRPPVRMRGVGDGANAAATSTVASLTRAFARDCKELFERETYVVTVLGYAAYTAVIGVYAVWGPKAGFAIFRDELHTSTNADVLLGAITVVSGIAGTLLGGGVVDKLGSSTTTALRTSAIAAIGGFVCLELAFRCKTFASFAMCLLVGQMFAFALQAPINAVVLWSVPARLRPLACSMTTVTIHLFGDVPSPPLFGHFLERDGVPTSERWRTVCSTFTLLFVVAAGVFATASRLADRSSRRRRVLDDDDDDDSRDVDDRLLPS
jgi:MFS family permease